jgi:hypothetical protein
VRKIAVATLMNGITISVGEREPPVEDEEQDRVPISVSVFWTTLVTPSVTSWSIASTSLVRRLMITPARLRS